MRKQHILYIVAITILFSLMITIDNSYINSNNTYALDYSSNVGIGFTFNPTLSISLSSNDLVIPNLVPGSTLDSNSINVSVATNVAYGYTLSANVNDENLVHSNNIDTFSSIDPNADLSSLDDSEDDNIWGYSYKNNIASAPTWSSYSGLSHSINKVLFNTDSNSSGSIDFKMAAKASNIQPSGVYTGTINFIAISKPIPRTIEDIAYMQTFGELDPTDLESVKSSMILNQDYILKDIRDEKEYHVAKLADDNVWMTQNLDHNIVTTTDFYTYANTDIGRGAIPDTNATWTGTATRTTNDKTWNGSDVNPDSYDPGDICWNGALLNSKNIVDCDQSDSHYHLGNYYNWTAAVAMTNSSSYVANNLDTDQSICPAGWMLPKDSSTVVGSGTFYNLVSQYGWSNSSYIMESSYMMWGNPLFFPLSGYYDGVISTVGVEGSYQTSVVEWGNYAYGLYFNPDGIVVPNAGAMSRRTGFSVRCLAR